MSAELNGDRAVAEVIVVARCFHLRIRFHLGSRSMSAHEVRYREMIAKTKSRTKGTTISYFAIMSIAHMYILKCSDGTYYTGSTKDLQRRIIEHQNGQGANYTKKRLPIELVYCKSFPRVEQAFRREKQVQNWSRKKKEAMIKGDDTALHFLSMCQNETSSKLLKTKP